MPQPGFEAVSCLNIARKLFRTAVGISVNLLHHIIIYSLS